MSSSQIASFASAGRLPAGVRKAFARMADLKKAIQRHRADVTALKDKRRAIFDDQKRIRGNIARVKRGSDLYNRYVQKLSRQEDRLETLIEAVDKARDGQKKAEDAFAEYVSKLNV